MHNPSIADVEPDSPSLNPGADCSLTSGSPRHPDPLQFRHPDFCPRRTALHSRPAILLLTVLLFAPSSLTAQARRPTPPTRNPHSPGYVKAKQLPDTQVPPPTADGNFILGPTHSPAPELAAFAAEPHPKGQVPHFAHGTVTSSP